MKRAIIAIILATFILVIAGACTNEGTPSASLSPAASASASQNPMTSLVPSPSAAQSPQASAQQSPQGSAGQTSASPAPSGMEGNFEEGKEVDIESIPEVKEAIENKYPDATIKSVTYAMYQEKEMYKVTIDNNNKETIVYVSMDAKDIVEGKA